MSLNRAMVIGYLGSDPELRFLPSGQSVFSFSVATNESYTDKQEQKQERVKWHHVVAFGRLAEICKEYLQKGRQAYVEGRLRTREYEAKNEGSYSQLSSVSFYVRPQRMRKPPTPLRIGARQ